MRMIRVLMTLVLFLASVAPVARAEKAPPGPYYIVLFTEGWNANAGAWVLAQITAWKRPTFPSLGDCDDFVARIPDSVQDRMMNEKPARYFVCRTNATGSSPGWVACCGLLSIAADISRLSRVAPDGHIKVVWLEQFNLSEWQH